MKEHVHLMWVNFSLILSVFACLTFETYTHTCVGEGVDIYVTLFLTMGKYLAWK